MNISRKNRDMLGIAASSLCILHCISTILLAIILPATAATFLTNERTHHFLFGAVLILWAGAFIPGYRLHKQTNILLVALLGLSILLTPFLLPKGYEHELLETGLTLLGGSIMIYAHWKNNAFCTTCQKKILQCASTENKCERK